MDQRQSARAAEKERARQRDLAAIASGEKTAAQVNSDNAIGAKVAGYFKPTLTLGVPSAQRRRAR